MKLKAKSFILFHKNIRLAKVCVKVTLAKINYNFKTQ